MRNPTVVVGAGIIGCMIAREMVSRDPEASVVVLDRDAAGHGASRRSAGLHFPRGATGRVRRMAAYSEGFYDSLRAARPSLPMHPLGMYVVAADTSEAHIRDVYLDSANLTRTDEVPEHDLLEQVVRVPAGAAVWRGDGCHYSDVRAIAQTLAYDMSPHLELREGVRVVAVEPTAEAVVLRLSTGGALTAGQVVLAPGPWISAPGWRASVAPLGVRVKKVVALHIECPPRAYDRTFIFHDEDAFLLPLKGQGRWLFSYTNHEWDVDPDTVGGGLTPADVSAGLDILRRYAPELAEAPVAGRVFCDAYSPSREPLVRVLDDRRVIFAGAANGSGYRLAPAIAQEVADLLHLPPRSQFGPAAGSAPQKASSAQEAQFTVTRSQP